MSVEKTADNILIIQGVTADRCLTIRTEIDLAGRTISKIWKAFVFTWRNVYRLNDYADVEIKDKRRLIEGYPLPFFVVSLVGKGRRLRIYSTDDIEEAKGIQDQLADFLNAENMSTQQPQ